MPGILLYYPKEIRAINKRVVGFPRNPIRMATTHLFDVTLKCKRRRMGSYLVRRTLQSAVLFVLITIITFTVVRLAPGGPAILANPNLNRTQIMTLRAGLGLEDPIPVQHVRCAT